MKLKKRDLIFKKNKKSYRSLRLTSQQAAEYFLSLQMDGDESRCKQRGIKPIWSNKKEKHSTKAMQRTVYSNEFGHLYKTFYSYLQRSILVMQRTVAPRNRVRFSALERGDNYNDNERYLNVDKRKTTTESPSLINSESLV